MLVAFSAKAYSCLSITNLKEVTQSLGAIPIADTLELFWGLTSDIVFAEHKAECYHQSQQMAGTCVRSWVFFPNTNTEQWAHIENKIRRARILPNQNTTLSTLFCHGRRRRQKVTLADGAELRALECTSWKVIKHLILKHRWETVISLSFSL